MTSESKKFHAFISHSSHDKDAAKRLALDLQGRGYSVWFDEWEILVGHNIVDEVFGAIKQSHFKVVILSEASVKSRWVDEELTAAKTREIEGAQVVILPAKLENCEIPTALTAKRYADFTGSWDYGVEEIARAIDGHLGNRPSRPTSSIAAPRLASPNFDALDQWREGLIPEMVAAGFVEGQPFKDVLIGAIDSTQAIIDRTLLMPLVDDSRVRISNWGGLTFPVDKSASTQEIRLQNGIRYVDAKSQLYGQETFHFWQMDSRLNFMHRDPVVEDFLPKRDREIPLSAGLVRLWALIDIVCPLLFARNILTRQPELEKLGVKFIWGGIKNRALLEISSNHVSFTNHYRYQCQVSEWIFETEITPDSDLAAEGQRAANDLFWLFGLEPKAETHDRELESLANGVVPR